MSMAKGLYIFIVFSKNQLLVSLTIAIIFFVSISFISALIFMILFLLLNFSFVLSLAGLGVKICGLFDILLVF